MNAVTATIVGAQKYIGHVNNCMPLSCDVLHRDGQGKVDSYLQASMPGSPWILRRAVTPHVLVPLPRHPPTHSGLREFVKQNLFETGLWTVASCANVVKVSNGAAVAPCLNLRSTFLLVGFCAICYAFFLVLHGPAPAAHQRAVDATSQMQSQYL